MCTYMLGELQPVVQLTADDYHPSQYNLVLACTQAVWLRSPNSLSLLAQTCSKHSYQPLGLLDSSTPLQYHTIHTTKLMIIKHK